MVTRECKQRLAVTLCDMKGRCYNQMHKSYKNYGGRGITICDEWLNKKTGHTEFRNWALNNGYSKGLSIDRINNDGNYTPTNCRWATKKQQSRNKRDTRIIEMFGVAIPLVDLAERFSICRVTLYKYLDGGMDIIEAISAATATGVYGVLQLDEKGNVIEWYDSVEEAANTLNCAKCTINMVCSNLRPMALGYKFRYVHRDPKSQEQIIQSIKVFAEEFKK